MKTVKANIFHIPKVIVLWVMAIIYTLPILYLFISTFKTKSELYTNPFGLPKHFTFENFILAIKETNYVRSISNSGYIVAVTVFFIVLISSAAAYAITRKNNTFYNWLYIFFLAGMIVPFQMTMLPLYKVMLALHLMNKLNGAVCVYLGITSPFCIFLFSGFIKNIPRELEEAAYIDGCGIFFTFIRVVFPLLKPVIATVAVLESFNVWNDFMMPLLFLSDPNKRTIVVQLFAFTGQYESSWNMILASIFLILCPVLIFYIFAQKYIISGITAGAVKG
jgi:raffinose/stachyose/melibiose transport system permease protein